MATSMDLHKGEVAARLNVANGLLLVARELKILELSILKTASARPFESFGPGFVS
jgi:hypothetical protein